MTSNALTQDNPIVRSEFRYQRFVIERGRNGRIWIFLAFLLIAPSLLASIGYTIGLMLNLFPVMDWYNMNGSWHLTILMLLIVVNVSMYVVVTLISIALANSSIAREKSKHTWSLLRLTDIDTDRIVLGKWWASLQALNGDHSMVIVLRVGLLAIALAIFIPSYHALEDITAPYRLYFLIMTPLIIIHGLLDASVSVSLGLWGAIPNDAMQTVASFAVMLTRLLLSLAVGWWFWNVLLLIQSNFVHAIYLTLAGIVATIILLILSLFVSQWLVENS